MMLTRSQSSKIKNTTKPKISRTISKTKVEKRKRTTNNKNHTSVPKINLQNRMKQWGEYPVSAYNNLERIAKMDLHDAEFIIRGFLMEKPYHQFFNSTYRNYKNEEEMAENMAQYEDLCLKIEDYLEKVMKIFSRCDKDNFKMILDFYYSSAMLFTDEEFKNLYLLV